MGACLLLCAQMRLPDERILYQMLLGVPNCMHLIVVQHSNKRDDDQCPKGVKSYILTHVTRI